MLSLWDRQVFYLYDGGIRHLPHVVIDGNTSSIDLRQALVPLFEEKETCRIKIEHIYIEREENSALVSAVVVEEGHSQSFYILVTKNGTDNQLTVRLDPSTDPIKTCGVKRSIATVAEGLLKQFSSLSVNRHNIQGYLEAEFI